MGKGKRRFGVGIALGALAAFMLARRMSAPRHMPNRARWQRELSATRGEAEAARLLALARARYDELYTGRSRPAKRALRFHLERSILPGLALYQTLLAEGNDRQAALAEMESLSTSSQAILSRTMPLLGRLRDPFPVLRRTTTWVMRIGFPAEGWDLKPVENSEDCLAFDIRRCFYLDTLTAYGAPELTPVFCHGDDAVFAKLPPSITWERTMTLGRGDERCNFRWRRVSSQR